MSGFTAIICTPDAAPSRARGMTNRLKPATQAENLRFQSQQHPLINQNPENPEEFVLSLIHKKAYLHAASMATGLRVLDIGCNHGYGTIALSESAAHVVGVDVSARAIEMASAERSAPNVTYQLVDGMRLPFADAEFDMVTAFQVIEHVVDDKGFIQEISRVLRSPGTAIFTTPNSSIRLDPGMRPWNKFHVREYTAQELQTQLAEEFSSVSVLGLTAPEPIYRLEYQRVNRARDRMRNSSAATQSLKEYVKALLPASVLSTLRSSFANFQFRETSNTLAGKSWTPDDLFYVHDEKERETALDLIAECKN